MRRAVRAEWTKLRTVRSNGVLALAAAASAVAIGATVTATLDPAACQAAGAGCDPDLPRLSLAGVYLGQVAVLVLAVLTATAEYDTGLIRTTLAADPRRAAVFSAKAAVVIAAALGMGAAGTLGSLAAARAILAGAGYPALSLADGPTLRAVAGTVLYLVLVALLGLGIGMALRDTAWSLSAVLAMLYMLPALAAILTDEQLRRWILRYSPMSAGLAIQATRRLDALPIGPWPGLAVLAAYSGAALALGATLFLRRDA